MSILSADILVAEDNIRDSKTITDALQGQHQLRVASTIRELREAMDEKIPDLLILDATLDVDGLEFFQAIRFSPDCPRAGVVILTAAGDVAMKEQASQLGAAEVIAKPLDSERVVTVVQDLLSFVETEV